MPRFFRASVTALDHFAMPPFLKFLRPVAYLFLEITSKKMSFGFQSEEIFSFLKFQHLLREQSWCAIHRCDKRNLAGNHQVVLATHFTFAVMLKTYFFFFITNLAKFVCGSRIYPVPSFLACSKFFQDTERN